MSSYLSHEDRQFRKAFSKMFGNPREEIMLPRETIAERNFHKAFENLNYPLARPTLGKVGSLASRVADGDREIRKLRDCDRAIKQIIVQLTDDIRKLQEQRARMESDAIISRERGNQQRLGKLITALTRQ